MKLYRITDAEFRPYGRKLDLDGTDLIEAAKTVALPETGSAYVASLDCLEACASREILEKEIFGELPVQIGYCYGHSNRLNALEWHKSSEINIAVTDLVLLLGKQEEIQNGRFDSANCRAFLVKAGECIEVYATSLHFCPCEVREQGFGCIVVLPQGTNLPLDAPSADPLLFRKNKWIIAHEENQGLIDRGVVGGVYGKNYTVTYDGTSVAVE